MSAYKTIPHEKTGKKSTLSFLNTQFIRDNWNKYYGTDQGDKIALLLQDLNRINNVVYKLSSVFNFDVSINSTIINKIYLYRIGNGEHPTSQDYIDLGTPNGILPADLAEMSRIIFFDNSDSLKLESDTRAFLSSNYRNEFKSQITDQLEIVLELQTLLTNGTILQRITDVRNSFGTDIPINVKYCLDTISVSITTLANFSWQGIVLKNAIETFTMGITGDRVYRREVFTLLNYLYDCATKRNSSNNSTAIDLTIDLINYSFVEFAPIFIKYLPNPLFNENISNKVIFMRIFTDFIKNCTPIVKAQIRGIAAIAAVKTAFGEPLKSNNPDIQAKINQSTFQDWYKTYIDPNCTVNPSPEIISNFIIGFITNSNPPEFGSGATFLQNSRNTYEFFVSELLLNLPNETKDFNVSVPTFCLVSSLLVIKSLSIDGFDTTVTSFGGLSVSLLSIVEMIYTFLEIDKLSLLSISDLRNTEMEEYMVQRISGSSLNASFLRPLLNQEFTITDPKGFNFIPLSSGAFVEASSNVSITLPFRNSSVRVINTSSNRISVKVFATGGEDGLYICPSPVIIEPKQDSYVSIV